MRRKIAMAGLALATLAVALVATLRWKSASDAKTRAARSAAILAVVDTMRERGRGWVETFDTPRSQPLGDYDPRWRHIFGRILVDRRLGAAVGDPDGGWERDGGDDYAFRVMGGSSGSVEIVIDGWWDGLGGIGAQGAVQSEAPHRLYEAALWRGKLALIYFVGPTPDKFEVLAESLEPPVRKGFYRIVLCMERRDSAWSLRAELRNPASGYAVIARTSVTDARLGGGGQGIGILGGGGTRSSYITGVAVRPVGDLARAKAENRQQPHSRMRAEPGEDRADSCGAGATQSSSP